jgi:hypothetical protein
VKQRAFAGSFAVALPLTLVAGCGIFSGDEHAGPSQVGDLVSWVERVYVDSELSKEKVQMAMERLQAIVASEYSGDAVRAYREFVEAVEQSERQARKLRSTVEPMKRSADPVFQQWSLDLLAFKNLEMRHRSQARLEATRERFDAVVATVDPAQTAYEQFNQGLRDHALFLGYDLNPTSVAEVKGDVHALAGLAAELDVKFDECLRAARAYVDSTALPMSADPGSMPPAPGGAAQSAR